MAPVDAALQELLRNDTERRTLALSTVQKIVNNILSHQDDPKYRRLRTENKAIKEKVLSAVGGGALLEALGFAAQGGDELVLPMEASPVTLLQARMKIDTALTQLTSPPSPAPPAPAAAPAAAPVASAPPAAASPAEDAMEVDAPADEVRPAEDEAMADGDDDLAAALALSATNNGLRHPPPTPASAPAAAPASAGRVGARLRSAAIAPAKTGSAIRAMLAVQTRHVCPISEGMRASWGASIQATTASIQIASTGSAAPIQARRTGTPGRASRCTITKAAPAIASGNSSLTQNIGQNSTASRSRRGP